MTIKHVSKKHPVMQEAYDRLSDTINDVMLELVRKHTSLQDGVDFLRGAHQALAYHLGTTERLLLTSANNAKDRATMQPLILKDREKLIEEGIKHSRCHERDAKKRRH